MATEVAKKTNIIPVLRLENGIFTKDEWDCILTHSVIKSFDDKLFLSYEHISKNRMR